MAMILDVFVRIMVRKLFTLLEERVVIILGVKQELEKLQRNLMRIKLVLEDAESKRIQSEAVAGWVKELKDMMYDADDIIDICRSEGGRLLGDQPSSSSSPPWVCCKFPSPLSCFSSVRFRHEIGDRIKKLNNGLDEILKTVSTLNLVQNERDVVRVTRVNPRQTSPVIESSDIVGRGIQSATDDLVELIRKDESKCQVIAVTGMGGIGKTTLAQNIYNHHKIQAKFSTRIWVCISQNYSETDLLREIISEFGGTSGHLQNKAQLLPLLKSVVSGKRYFLVLDDVWRADVWNDLLRSPLKSGAISSRVLVTTRDSSVARQMGTMHIHPIEQLPVESGWELLCKSAFITGVEEMHSLRDVGIQIVEKCHGLPLAIKTVAGVLTRKERSKGEWEKILTKDAWSMDKLPDDLRGALYLSYEDLPSPLKQCFLYLSLFPEDFAFSRRDVIKYWVVEGFVGTQTDEFEELADEYFEELVWRNLIQKQHPDEVTFYRIHDLLRSLAQFLSQEESFCGDGHDLAAMSTAPKLRRLRFNQKDAATLIPEPFVQQKHLRTLFLERCPVPIGKDLLMKFPYLRLLCLSDSEIEHVPEAIGNLRHLRLLDLDRTKISSLPESIKYLTNLQVLYLSGCKLLYTLPEGITRLYNLRFIDLVDTPLNFMPAGMGSLAQLNCFNGFSVGVFRSGVDEKHELGCRLEELMSLLHLKDLSICNLERAMIVQKGQLVLKNKHHLKNLVLHCSIRDRIDEYTEEEIDNIENVFEELLPPPCLEKIDIMDYFGRRFSSWMMSSSLGTSLPRLRYLFLYNCTTILQLPPLGLLPELVHLDIIKALGVVTMGLEFVGSNEHAMPAYFPKLERLTINNMMGLEEWSVGGDEEEGLIVLPSLRILEVFECPKLKSILKGLKQSALKELKIASCPSWEKVSELPALRELEISHCGSLESLSELPALRELYVESCPSLICVEEVHALENLTLNDTATECLPEWLLGLLQHRWQLQQNLNDKFHLHLTCDSILMRKCLMGCEYWPIIQNIPRFHAYVSSAEYIRYSKQPFEYETCGIEQHHHDE